MTPKPTTRQSADDVDVRNVTAATANVTEQNSQPSGPKGLDDVEWFMANIQLSDDSELTSVLPWKEGFDKSKWCPRWFRYKEVDGNRKGIEALGYKQVQKDGFAYGVPFSEMFEDSLYGPDGLAIRGGFTDRKTEKARPEYYLFICPKAAYDAFEIKHQQAWHEYANPRQSAEIKSGEAELRSERGSEFMTVKRDEMGVETGRSAWPSIG